MRIKNLKGWRTHGNKYGAVKTVVDGIKFDSKAEAARYLELKLLKLAGKIMGLVIHPVYPIVLHNREICKVILDFKYYDFNLGQGITEDVKGLDNALSRLKRKLVEAQYGIKVDVITANARAGKNYAAPRSPRGQRVSPKRVEK